MNDRHVKFTAYLCLRGHVRAAPMGGLPGAVPVPLRSAWRTGHAQAFALVRHACKRITIEQSRLHVLPAPFIDFGVSPVNCIRTV
jgi:hypothetical protein